MAKLTNARLNAVWQIAATLNMGNANNSLLAAMKTQPDGAYSQANINDFQEWLKIEMGKDGSLAKWFPGEVYASVIGKIENFVYNKTAVGESYLPPENASGGSGEITCDEDSTGAARDVKCWKWDYVDFDEMPAGSLAGGTWTFSGLSAGNYVLVFDDYATNESFPTAYISVS